MQLALTILRLWLLARTQLRQATDRMQVHRAITHAFQCGKEPLQSWQMSAMAQAKLKYLGEEEKSLRRLASQMEPTAMTTASLSTATETKVPPLVSPFTSPAARLKANQLIKAQKLHYEPCDAKLLVWLDAETNREELRPNRIVQRVCTACKEFENNQAVKVDMEPQLGRKAVAVNGQPAHSPILVGWTCNGTWIWSAWATHRYADDERGYVDVVAESA